MSYEFSRNPENDLETRLHSAVNGINEWVSGRNERGSHADTTERKLLEKLARLTGEFQSSAVYIRAPLMLLPMENGTLGRGVGEATGEIVGFQHGAYPTISETFEVGPLEQGVVAIVATGGSNTNTHTPASWDRVIPEQLRALGGFDDYKDRGLVPVLIPVTPGTRFTEVDNSTPLNFDLSRILSAEFAEHQPKDYLEYVARIHKLMQGKPYGVKGTDEALMAALQAELLAMNKDYPHLGQQVEVSARHMRVPSQIREGGTTTLAGTTRGTFGRFTYAPYFSDSRETRIEARGAVQAVIYSPETARLLFSGQLTRQQADKMPNTVFVPLDQEHTLLPIRTQ